MRRAARRDENEKEIVDVLRNAGCDVVRLNEIDLLVGLAKVNYLLEVKLNHKSDIKPFQKRMRDTWQGQYAIVTTAEQALRAVGLWV